MPDGRPLYAYKISDGHYNALKVLLKDSWEESTECFACFVLFAVEYLRGEFDERHLNWDAIFSAIDKSKYNQPAKRSSIITRGIEYWDRPLFRSEHSIEYIESLRLESGLPSACLNIESGVSRLVTKAFQVFESYQVNEDALVALIKDFPTAQYIPGVLQQATFYELVAKICLRFLELKERFHLGEEARPIEVLNAKHPTWKENMPLKVSGEKMEGFFDNLISEISKVEKLERPVIRVVHELVENDGQASIRSQILLPKGYYSPSALSIDDIGSFNDLPTHFLMVVESEDLVIPLAHLSKTVEGKVVSGGYFIEVPFKVYGKDWMMGLSSNKHSIEVPTEISNEFQLKQDEPLLFCEDDEGKWVFQGSGNLKLRQSSGRILIPDSIRFVGEYLPEKIGQTASGLSIYQIEQTSTLADQSDNFMFNIVLNHDSDAKNVISLRQADYGIRSQHWIKKLNKHIWFGVPFVYSIHPSFGIRERFNGTVSILSDGAWREITDIRNYIGNHKLKFTSRTHEILGYQSMSLLPEDFNVEILEREAMVRIHCKESFRIFPERQEVNCAIRQEESGVAISFDLQAVPEDPYVNFLLVLRNGDELKIKLPNPAIHEEFVNSAGEIANGEDIALDKFHGNSIAIHNFSGRTISKQYILRLIDPHGTTDGEISISREIKISDYTLLRLPMFHWAADINALFSMAQSVDAYVKISSGRPHHFVNALRFDFGAKIFEGQLSIDGARPAEVEIKAFRLDERFTPSIVSNVSYEEELSKWNLEKSLAQAGVWFVYSGNMSEKKVRPKVFLNKIELQDSMPTSPVEHLHETCLMSFQDRLEALIHYFDSKHNDFDDPVWQELYELYKETSHLPFSTLDVWKGLVKSEKGMLTFLLSNWCDHQMIVDLTKEFSFSWQLIPLSLWSATLEAWSIKIMQQPHFQQLLEIKMELIKKELHFWIITEILNGLTSNSNTTQYQGSLSSLINGDGSSGLRLRHSEGTGKWPNIVSDFIMEKFKQLPDEARAIIPGQFPNFQKPVIYLPVIIAYQFAKGNFIDQSKIDEKTKLGLMLTAEFDEDYFRQAYHLSQIFFYSN